MITELKFIDQKTLTSVSSKERDRKELERKVKEFLNSNGKIEVVESPEFVGVSSRAVGFCSDFI